MGSGCNWEYKNEIYLAAVEPATAEHAAVEPATASTAKPATVETEAATAERRGNGRRGAALPLQQVWWIRQKH